MSGAEQEQWIVEVRHGNESQPWRKSQGHDGTEASAREHFDRILYTPGGGACRLSKLIAHVVETKELTEPPVRPPPPDPNGLDKEEFGRHRFPGVEAQNEKGRKAFFTSDCDYGCGAWMGSARSGGPDGGDEMNGAFGLCPRNPLKVDGGGDDG